MRTGAVIHASAISESARGPQLKMFSRHVVEMTVAMLLGMAVLGTAFRAFHLAVFGTGFDDAWHEHTALAVFAMTFNMTLPMVGVMRYRGHGWERCGEMAAAMFALAIAPARPVLARRVLGQRGAAAGDGADVADHDRRDGPPI